MEVVQEILQTEGLSSAEDIARNWALLIALSKVEQYQAESEHFEYKYQMAFAEFETANSARQDSEDFAEEDGLDDWIFSLAALKTWEKKVRDLQNADESLNVRWDNAPHWQVETFPHHKHVEQEDNVVASFKRTLEQVLKL